MSSRRFRFVSITYRIIAFLLILIPGIAGAAIAWKWSVEFALDQADRELRQSATAILNVVRMRYDLVQNYLFQEERYLEENLSSTVLIMQRIARELELEGARSRLSEYRAQTVFKAFAGDLSETENHQIVLLDESDRVIQHPLLPARFDMGHYRWVQQMRENEAGILRYTWSYPGEAMEVERMAAYRVIHAWDWIVSVEGRVPDPENSDFADRQIQGLTDFITGYQAPAGGYAMILSAADGTVVTHPESTDGGPQQLAGVDVMLGTRRGNVTYSDSFGFKWRAGVDYFAPRKWNVVVTARNDEILRQTRRLALRLFGVITGMAVLAALIFYRMNRSLIYAAVSHVRKSALDYLE